MRRAKTPVKPEDPRRRSAYFAPLREALAGVDRPGDFYAQGALTTPLPRIDVDGVGTVAFPLQRFQAEQLIAVADRAPFGRGPETVTDPAVRRCWQIGPDRLRVGGTVWPATLASIVSQVAAGLGCTGEVEAQLYKALLYDEGAFFLEHRDTEKVDGMFATLVVVLPSAHRGGELVVRHAGREAVLDLPGDDVSRLAFAAFYADCPHELRPIVAGYRLALVFNLVRVGSKSGFAPPDYGSEIVRAASFLASWSRSWAERRASGGEKPAPEKLIWVLDHHYTSAGLSFGGLKNGDRASPKGCSCADCEALGAFLRNPKAPTWEFKAAEGRRRHLELRIREERADLDVTTKRVGSPHLLVCTKNQGSYERRCQQRVGDLAAVAALSAPPLFR